MGIGQTIQETACKDPDKPALIFENTVIRYRSLYQTINKLRAQLKKLIANEKQVKIALCLGNEPAFLEVFLATVTLGWIAIPLDPNWTEREMTETLAKIKPNAVISSKHLQQAAMSVPYEAIPIEKLKEIPVHAPETPWPSFTTEPFYIGLTSGTTSTSKQYIRSHTSWLASFQAAEKAFHLTKEATILAPGPLCYSLSLCAAIHALHRGAIFYLTSSFQPAKIRTALQSQAHPYLFAVPAMLQSLARTDVRSEKKITFISAGDLLRTEVVKRLKQSYPFGTIFEYYGASELSYVGYRVCQSEEKRDFTPFPGVRVSTWTENNKPAAPGEVGQIYVESPLVFSGYLDESSEMNKGFTPHGATVDDIGIQAQDGTFSIIGRKKNMLITGGVNVYPEEIEQIIKELPAISEVIVIGEENALHGQKGIALIQWKTTPDMQKVKAHCRKNLAAYKMPKRFVPVASLPRTSNGKIDRAEVAKQVARGVF